MLSFNCSAGFCGVKLTMRGKLRKQHLLCKRHNQPVQRYLFAAKRKHVFCLRFYWCLSVRCMSFLCIEKQFHLHFNVFVCEWKYLRANDRFLKLSLLPVFERDILYLHIILLRIHNFTVVLLQLPFDIPASGFCWKPSLHCRMCHWNLYLERHCKSVQRDLRTAIWNTYHLPILLRRLALFGLCLASFHSEVKFFVCLFMWPCKLQLGEWNLG